MKDIIIKYNSLIQVQEIRRLFDLSVLKKFDDGRDVLFRLGEGGEAWGRRRGLLAWD